MPEGESMYSLGSFDPLWSSTGGSGQWRTQPQQQQPRQGSFMATGGNGGYGVPSGGGGSDRWTAQPGYSSREWESHDNGHVSSTSFAQQPSSGGAQYSAPYPGSSSYSGGGGSGTAQQTSGYGGSYGSSFTTSQGYSNQPVTRPSGASGWGAETAPGPPAAGGGGSTGMRYDEQYHSYREGQRESTGRDEPKRGFAQGGDRRRDDYDRPPRASAAAGYGAGERDRERDRERERERERERGGDRPRSGWDSAGGGGRHAD
eukprot:Sspe_Gene.79204::Locus_49623_Transcript_1_1_Confidence_1.000_Length_874::g.79204::m.79204